MGQSIHDCTSNFPQKKDFPTTSFQIARLNAQFQDRYADSKADDQITGC